MKSEYFLALPVLATLFNVSLLFFFHIIHGTHGQPVIAEGLSGRCVDSGAGECGVDLDGYLTEERNLAKEHQQEDEEEDPQLFQMPGTDFKAYVRADISSFYQEEPGSRVEKKPHYTGQAGKFVNMSPEPLDLCWDGPNGPVFNDVIGPWQAGGTATFPTHNFVFTKHNRHDQVLCRMEVVPGVSVYYCDPFADENTHPTADPRARGKQLMGGGRSLDTLSTADREQYEAHKYNLHFASLYKNFTGGSEWLTMYPKDPPNHKIWRADYFGQEHFVQTKQTQFQTIPPPEQLHRVRNSEMRQITNSSDLPFAEYRAPGEMTIKVKALSVAPRAFEVRHFLSDAEVDHIVDIVNRKSLARSTTNGHLSETRTSSTTWVPRDSDPVLDAIFRRVADTLRMDEAMLRDRAPHEYPDYPTSQRVNEDLQIVHYDKGQQYTAHHDFGYPKGETNSPSRSINFCMYLRDVEEGGETSFPRWRNGETGEAIGVKPEKGKAMIFYMVNPDGNLDDLTHHAALPVIKGEKLFSNLWIWDPVRSRL